MAKPGCSAPTRFGQRAYDLVVGPALARRLDQLRPQHDVLVAAALVEVVVLEEHGGGQHDVGHPRGLGHELLVHGDEQVVAGKPCLTRFWSGATDAGLVFWMTIAGDRRAVADVAPDRR
jgi:hypothetical protein